MEQVNKYFRAERIECWLGILIGLASLGLAIYFFTQHTSFDSGLAYTFLGASVVQLIVCTIVVVRTPKDIIRVQNFLETDKNKVRTEEIPRMGVVLKNFVIYRYAEIGLVIIGLALLLMTEKDTVWLGVGDGLIFNGALMLTFDFFAERRGKVYINFLKSLI